MDPIPAGLEIAWKTYQHRLDQARDLHAAREITEEQRINLALHARRLLDRVAYDHWLRLCDRCDIPVDADPTCPCGEVTCGRCEPDHDLFCEEFRALAA